MVEFIKTASKSKALLFCVVGYLGGILLFLLFPSEIAFMNEESGFFNALSQEFVEQLKYFLLVYLCAFCTFSELANSAIMFTRAAVAGYAAAVMFNAYSQSAVYFLHTVFSALILILLACACKATQEYQTDRDFRILTLKLLYICGALMILLFILKITVLFI